LNAQAAINLKNHCGVTRKMDRTELIKRLYAHPLSEFHPGELERSSTSDLEQLLRLLNAYKNIPRGTCLEDEYHRAEITGDEPPKLTDEDEEILDRIWTCLGEASN
jgi:hypothetical protein